VGGNAEPLLFGARVTMAMSKSELPIGSSVVTCSQSVAHTEAPGAIFTEANCHEVPVRIPVLSANDIVPPDGLLPLCGQKQCAAVSAWLLDTIVPVHPPEKPSG